MIKQESQRLLSAAIVVLVENAASDDPRTSPAIREMFDAAAEMVGGRAALYETMDEAMKLVRQRVDAWPAGNPG